MSREYLWKCFDHKCYIFSLCLVMLSLCISAGSLEAATKHSSARHHARCMRGDLFCQVLGQLTTEGPEAHH